ncbi:MAG: rhodanese-like domain-containing protein [Oscillibacter sp.]|nr:rhodanese-like domain-containing protein [Oscillibacter sp.]
MGFFDFMKAPDINQGLTEYSAASGAVLLDVRTPQEYREGHIPGSINVPLQSLGAEGRVPAEKNAALFVYCHSGARSRQAVELLGRLGFANVKNIGGIAAYKGRVER